MRKSEFKKPARFLAILLLLVTLTLSSTACLSQSNNKSNLLNASILTDGNVRLTEVPAGWIGIYSKEDLDNIRNIEKLDRKQNFILMNDITFTDADYTPGGAFEGGWNPLFNYNSFGRASFIGTFNGNGHIIYNLKVNTVNDSNCTGLFGCTEAVLINLGIEGGEINTTIIPGKRECLYSGAIAGKADFIGCCYATGLKVNISFSENTTEGSKDTYYPQLIFVGGLAGYSSYVDSCYTNADISVQESSIETKIYIGGLAGASVSAVTSYFNGSINADPAKLFNCITEPVSVCYSGISMLTMVPKDAMEKLFVICSDYYGSNSFSYKKIEHYYLLRGPSQVNNDRRKEELQELNEEAYREYFFIGDASGIIDWYIFDPTASFDEKQKMMDLIITAFGGYEDYSQFCLENNIKVGLTSCYSFSEGETFSKKNLEDFDFKNIWIVKKEKATLRIFKT